MDDEGDWVTAFRCWGKRLTQMGELLRWTPKASTKWLIHGTDTAKTISLAL